MKVLVVGHEGQLGRDLLFTAPGNVQVIGYDLNELDISLPDEVNETVNRVLPDTIINAAAYTAVDKAESDVEVAFRVNAGGPANLAIAARSSDSRLIHISTDYVFDGMKNTPYLPSDPVNPLGVYGKSKADGEKQVLDCYPENSVIIRTAWLYSTCGHNFVKTMLKLMQEKDEITVVSDQTGSPTWSRNLAQIIWKFIHADVPAGIYHWTDAGTATWHDYARAIHDISMSIGLLDRKVKIIPVTSAEYPTAAPRPRYSVLETGITSHMLGVKNRDWRAALTEMLTEFKKLHHA